MTSTPTWENMSALGGTRTPNLLIRSLVPRVRPVRRSPYPQVRVQQGVQCERSGPVLSNQSVRNP